MRDIKKSFDMPIPASLLNFKFKEANFAEIKYSLDKVTKEVFVYAIECGPIILQTITNMPEFVRHVKRRRSITLLHTWKSKSILPIWSHH